MVLWFVPYTCTCVSGSLLVWHFNEAQHLNQTKDLLRGAVYRNAYVYVQESCMYTHVCVHVCARVYCMNVCVHVCACVQYVYMCMCTCVCVCECATALYILYIYGCMVHCMWPNLYIEKKNFFSLNPLLYPWIRPLELPASKSRKPALPSAGPNINRAVSYEDFKKHRDLQLSSRSLVGSDASSMRRTRSEGDVAIQSLKKKAEVS